METSFGVLAGTTNCLRTFLKSADTRNMMERMLYMDLLKDTKMEKQNKECFGKINLKRIYNLGIFNTI